MSFSVALRANEYVDTFFESNATILVARPNPGFDKRGKRQGGIAILPKLEESCGALHQSMLTTHTHQPQVETPIFEANQENR